MLKNLLELEKIVNSQLASKITRSKRGMRRAHDSLRAINVIECPNCGEQKITHHICKACGYYGDKEIIPIVEDIDVDDDAA